MSFGALAGVALALGVVLALLAVAMRALQQFSGTQPRPGGGLPLRVVQRVSLAPRQGLAIVRLGERALVVSVGDGGVRAVSELLPEEVAALESANATTGAGGADALGRLRGLLAGLPLDGRRMTETLRAGRFAGALRGGRRLALVLLCALPLLSLAQPAAAQAATTAATAQDGQANAQAAGDAVLDVAARAAAAQLAPNGPGPRVNLQVGDGDASDLQISGTVGSVIMIGLLALLPTLLLLMTGFTRILIVLHLLRQAIGTQTAPPGHMLAALALLLTGFVMAPTLTRVNEVAVQPWLQGQIDEGQMMKAGLGPFRTFMLAQTPEEDLVKFVEMSNTPAPETAQDVPLPVLMTAYATSELRAAFQMGFAVFLPFIIIDLVVSAVLTGMGMFMLPPTMIALPCKLLLFVLVDGWTLTVQSLLASFR
jgi:flagellar biosynthesis protein FliP